MLNEAITISRVHLKYMHKEVTHLGQTGSQIWIKKRLYLQMKL